MKTLIALTVAIVFLSWYVVAGRKWLKNQSWAQGFFAAIEPVELFLYKKSETILYQRAKQLIAVLLVVLPQIGAIDLTPYLGFIPENHRWWVALIPSVALSFDATIGEMLRNRTSKPIELVGAPTTPATIVAEAKVEIANAEAVATAAEAVKAA